MKKPRMTAVLTAVLCLAGAGVLLTSYAQQNTAVKSAAAKLYRQNCAVCHGLPGEPRNAIANGMFPKPPQLFRGMGVTDDEAWESFAKISGGIRMSGMPGFRESLSDTQMWQLSQLVKSADKLPASVKAELAAATPGAAVPTLAPAAAGKSDEEHEHDHVH